MTLKTLRSAPMHVWSTSDESRRDKKRPSLIRYLSTAGLLFAFLYAQTGSAQAAEAKYPIASSNTLAHTFGATDPQFFWINNDELLFLAVRPSSSNEKAKYAVSRWDTRTGAVSRVKDFGENRPRICFSDGYVLYQFRRKDETLEAYHGKLGQPERAVDAKEYSQLFCRPRDETPKLPSWTAGRDIHWLRTLDGGFVDFGERRKALENTPVRLYAHNAKQEEGTQLPFGRREISWRFPYYQFKDAFFVESHYSLHPRPQGVPYPVYWLYRDGRVEKIADIPWGPWRSRANFSVFPSSAGLILYSNNARNEFDLGHAGLYLLRFGKVERIVEGWIVGMDVSPNGCKVAFTHAATITRNKNVLQSMTLCERG